MEAPRITFKGVLEGPGLYNGFHVVLDRWTVIGFIGVGGKFRHDAEARLRPSEFLAITQMCDKVRAMPKEYGFIKAV